MAGHKGKPSGTYAEKKTSPGKKGNYQRSGWPEDAHTQRVKSNRGKQQGKARPVGDRNFVGTGRGRDRKAGSPR